MNPPSVCSALSPEVSVLGDDPMFVRRENGCETAALEPVAVFSYPGIHLPGYHCMEFGEAKPDHGDADLLALRADHPNKRNCYQGLNEYTK